MDIETQKFMYCLEMYQRWLSGDYLTMGEIDAALRGYFAVQRAKKLAGYQISVYRQKSHIL